MLVAERLLECLDDRGIERCVMGGISLGGYLTMAVATLRPTLLAGVALCDTKATADGEPAPARHPAPVLDLAGVELRAGTESHAASVSRLSSRGAGASRR